MQIDSTVSIGVLMQSTCVSFHSLGMHARSLFSFFIRSLPATEKTIFVLPFFAFVDVGPAQRLRTFHDAAASQARSRFVVSFACFTSSPYSADEGAMDAPIPDSSH